MELKPDSEALFLAIFEHAKEDIRAQKGCLGIELLRGTIKEEMLIWTISLWQTPEDLDLYRSSPLFKKTWAAVKPLFAARAQAWTLTSIEVLP